MRRNIGVSHHELEKIAEPPRLISQRPERAFLRFHLTVYMAIFFFSYGINTVVVV